MDDLSVVAKQLSELGGQYAALTAALAAICETLRPDSEMAGLIYARLEQTYASKLHLMQNEPYLAGFEETRGLLVDMLEVAPPAG